MELHNASKLQASYASALFKDGRSGIVMIAKGSWPIKAPENTRPCLLPESEALPIQETDTFTGEPGLSAPVYENDFPSVKPFCDVIMHACAHAPQGKSAEQVQVGLEVSNIAKFFVVTGACKWTKWASLTPPQPFTAQPVSYDLAFGGTDLTQQDKGQVKVCMANPVGRGFMPLHPFKAIEGKPGPQTHETGKPVVDPSLNYAPQSFGPIARNWAPRHQFGGTYDQHWIEQVRPFLPDDFDERFYQCAPPDQQTAYLQGGETVTLHGVSPEGTLTFKIPENAVYMAVIDHHGTEHVLSPQADTLIIEPELNRFSIVWRANWPVHRTPEEVDTILVGTPTRGWRHARMTGKTFVADKGKRIG
ncbi:hypothetical protein VA7868_03562 [Vibrio aerogenes CECT 7868]|uniref:DUF2169 domain-containing protein n=1 Tax=Vibrio aerogenes CECT 7868 TaxID=1216006 RepID=A0A1M6AFD1_9VIBR|nr:DUF2169 domain-containing protein [Vibrio aerogenes]SHI35117.1 hypothetical protein VA7868_03562 [Vibrio aerogenes CECT 7868]